MIAEPPAESTDLREDVDSLLIRLARLDAHRVTLRSVADSLQGDGTSPTLAAVLDTLERDLMLATFEVNRVHARATRS
jgi:hypothetical protein